MIGLSHDGDVAILQLQRPDRRNALSTELCLAVRSGIEQAERDGARVVVVTGEGSSFCAGADLTGDAFPDAFPAALEGMLLAVESASIPVIAAVNGPAVGAGTQLAIACDLRVVAPESFFEVPSTRLGIAVSNWTITRLATLAGGGVARTIMLGGERVYPDQAFSCGLANKLGDLDVATAWAHSITELAPLALRHHKLVLNDDGAHDDPTPEQSAAFHAAWSSEDVKEARRARAEKRKPRFVGK